MKKFLSILLTVVMLLQTAALAAPQAVTIGDLAVEVPVESKEKILDVNEQTDSNETCHSMLEKWFPKGDIFLCEDNDILTVIESYFEIRAKSLVDDSCVNSDFLSDELLYQENTRRKEHKERQVNARINIVDVAHHIAVQLNQEGTYNVREWIFYDYEDLTTNEKLVDVAGFGVDHIITIEEINGKYSIVCDINNEKDEEVKEVVDEDVSVETDEEHAMLMSTNYYTDYDVNAVIKYADKWATSRNPAYYDFSDLGGDCANFTSQSIFAGGMPQVVGSQYGTNGWFYKTSSNRSATWTGASPLRTWMANNRGKKVDSPSNSEIYVGSPVFYDWYNDGSYDHATICVGTNSSGRAIINSHTNDKYHEVWNYGYSNTKYSTVQLTESRFPTPSKPTISGHSDETSTSVKIKWKEVSGATKYKLEYRPAGGEWDADGISKTVTGTSYEATGLVSGKLYWFRLYAINDAGSSGKSEQYGVYLDGPKPETETVSTTSIKITWPHVGGNTEYELRYKKSGDSADDWVSVSGKFSKDEREYIHTGLEPGTQYYYKTKAYNLDDESVISDYTADNSGFTKLSSPTVTSNASNSVSIKWERGTMNGDYTYTYRVLRKASYETVYDSMAVVSSKSYTDTTVKPNTEYRYYIDVLRNGDYIVHSDVVTVTTPSCSHTYSSWTTTKAATCTASGSKTRTCTKCSAVETGTISATGHSYSSWTTTTAATCTTAGVSTRTCSKCSAKETQAIAATGHSLSEWSVKTEATCLADGEKTRHCTNSGCSYNETDVIKAFGSHDYVEVERVEPTNVDGYVKYTCANCNDSYTKVIPAVVVSVTSVSLDKAKLSMEIGKTETLVATITPDNATVKDVKWISSDESVATVVDGEVTAIGEGSTTITVMTADGRKTATCTVTVTKPEEEEPDTPVVPEEPAEYKATMTLSDVSGRQGETVKVVVSLKTENEINTIGLKEITYDDSILTFTGFSDYEELESNCSLSSFDEEKLAVVAALKDAQIFDGEICTLNFIINEEAEECEVTVNAVANIKLNHDTVATEVVPATVTVISQILGDLNRDEYVDMNDAVLLLQHSMFPELYPIEYSGSVDFTRDGYVDMNDAVLLLQYSMFPELYPIEK